MHDFLVFLVKGSYDAGGIMTGELTTGVAVESLGIGIIYAGFGLWLLRRSARGDVADIWRERWKMDETAVSEAETVTE